MIQEAGISELFMKAHKKSAGGVKNEKQAFKPSKRQEYGDADINGCFLCAYYKGYDFRRTISGDLYNGNCVLLWNAA